MIALYILLALILSFLIACIVGTGIKRINGPCNDCSYCHDSGEWERCKMLKMEV